MCNRQFGNLITNGSLAPERSARLSSALLSSALLRSQRLRLMPTRWVLLRSAPFNNCFRKVAVALAVFLKQLLEIHESRLLGCDPAYVYPWSRNLFIVCFSHFNMLSERCEEPVSTTYRLQGLLQTSRFPVFMGKISADKIGFKTRHLLPASRTKPIDITLTNVAKQ